MTKKVTMTSLRHALARLWAADDDAAFVESGGRWVNWGAVRSLTERIDAELSAAGCREGGRVAVVLENRAESVAALLAILRGDRTLVTLNPLQPSHRLSADVAATGVGYVLAPEKYWSETEFVAAVTDLGAGGWAVEGATVDARVVPTRVPEPGDPAVAVEMLTSGTTGPPKRVPLTTTQLEASLAAPLRHSNRPEVSERLPLTGAVAIVMLSLVHIGGLFGLLQAIATARPVVLLERFTVDGWHAAVKEHRPVLAGLPPPAIRAVLDADIPSDDLASIRAINSGTSSVEPALVDAFLERYGIPILTVYGATEFTGAVAGWTLPDFRARWAEKKGSVGRAFPGVRFRLVDDDGAPLPTGRSGRLQIASAQAGGDPDRWVTTSDLAHLDEDGFLYIDGRADDVIIRGGFKIAPETVVKALRSHEAVLDAAVVGVSDERLGEVPVAAVELRDGASVTPEELRQHTRSVLTPYEVPARVVVVEHLPRECRSRSTGVSSWCCSTRWRLRPERRPNDMPVREYSR